MEKKRKKNVSKYLALVVFLIGYAIVLLIIYPPQRQMNETAKHLTIFSSLSELDFLKADGEIVPDDEPISGAMECVRVNVKYQNHTFAVEAYKFDHIDSARTWFSEYSGWYDAEISEEFYRNWEPFREAFLVAYKDNLAYCIKGSACRDYVDFVQYFCNHLDIPLKRDW